MDFASLYGISDDMINLQGVLCIFPRFASLSSEKIPWRPVNYPWWKKVLSHTWVQYPGFWGHGVKCPILTTVVPGFFGDLIGCTIRSKWGPFGDLYLAWKSIFCVWNKLFLGEIKFSQRRTRPVKSLWWQIVSMQESINEWKSLTIFEIMGLAETQW